MRNFVSALPTKKVSFMDQEIEIKKLSAGAVKRIGKASKELDATKEDDSMSSLLVILKEGVVLPEGEEPITTELLEEFPIDELAALSTAVMEFAGVSAPKEGEGNEG